MSQPQLIWCNCLWDFKESKNFVVSVTDCVKKCEERKSSTPHIPTRIMPFLACGKPSSQTVCWLCVLVFLVNWSSSVSQVRLRCQKGIPPALRGRAWLYLSGGKVKREQNHGKFQVRNLPLSLPHHSCFESIFGFVSCLRFIRNCNWNCGREPVLLSYPRTLMWFSETGATSLLVLLVYKWKMNS